MASLSAGSSRDTTVPPPLAVGAPSNAASAPVDTTQLDTLVEKALTAGKSCRHALEAGFYRRAAGEALRLHGDTFVCTYLTLRRALALRCQAQLEGVTQDEKAALRAEAWGLASGCLPLLVRRMDANTMLPGRGTAVELAFFKRFTHTAANVALLNRPPSSTRELQLVGLSFGYATAVLAADMLLGLLCVRRDSEAQAFVLRVVECMLPATRCLAEFVLGDEFAFSSKIQQVLSGAFPTYDAAFVASLRAKWTAAAMVQMCRARGLLDVSEKVENFIEDDKTRWRADIAQHGLEHCALPSCDKLEASVQQYKFCSACRSVWYCSAEHGALHWKEHKTVCRAAAAAQQAADDAGAGAA